MRSKYLSPFLSGWLVLAAGLAVMTGSGCCVTHPCGSMASLPCDGDCGATCDSGGCDSGCGPTFPASCGTHAPCHGLSGLALPLLSTKLACGSGCGGVYWNEWISDPPDCCDPCNDCGQWTGHCGGNSWSGQTGCGPGHVIHGAWRGVTHVTGSVLRTVIYGYPGACGGCGSCSSCMSAGPAMGGDCVGGACGDGYAANAQAIPTDAVVQDTIVAGPEQTVVPQQVASAPAGTTRRMAAGQRLRR